MDFHGYQAETLYEMTEAEEDWKSYYVLWAMAAGKTALIHAYLTWAFEHNKHEHVVIMTPFQSTRDGFDTSLLTTNRRTINIGSLTYEIPKDLVQALHSDTISGLRSYLEIPNPKYAVVICDATARSFVTTNTGWNDRVLVIGDECHGHGAPAMRNWVQAMLSRGAKIICMTATPYRHDGKPVLPPEGIGRVLLGPVRTYAEQVRDGLAPNITLLAVPVHCENKR
jgi:hypothetical protein